jgi:hypothetical protein
MKKILKNLLMILPFILAPIFAVNIISCDDLFKSKTQDSIATSNSNGLQEVIVIPNGTLVTGTLPTASTGTTIPKITSSQPSVSFNPGVQFQLPIGYTSSTNWKYVYISVQGSTNGYIKVTNSSSTSTTSGTIVIPITLPELVKYGTFTVTYCIVDANGLISNWVTSQIVLRVPLTCADAHMSGSEGLTAMSVNLGTKAGTVNVNYDTYTVPDRIDVYQGTRWLAGTGADTGLLVPPLCQCSSPLPGFVGKTGVLTFTYNPSNGQYITIYVSGCLGNSTAWTFSMVCAQ